MIEVRLLSSLRWDGWDGWDGRDGGDGWDGWDGGTAGTAGTVGRLPGLRIPSSRCGPGEYRAEEVEVWCGASKKRDVERRTPLRSARHDSAGSNTLRPIYKDRSEENWLRHGLQV